MKTCEEDRYVVKVHREFEKKYKGIHLLRKEREL